MRALRKSLAGVGLILLGLAAAQAEEPTASVKLTIPAQPMSAALNAFAQQTGLQVIFPVEEITADGAQAPRVVGTFTPRAALQQLLANSKLRYEFVNDRTVAIRSAKSSGTAQKKISATQGASPDRPLRIAQAQAASGAGQLQEEESGARESSLLLEEVIVTGSRLKRVDKEGPSPVMVISREAIDRSGAATTREVLNRITQSSVNLDESGNASFLGASTVQLRGLPVGTTLMLLNGRRLGASGAQVAANFFDLNNIPLEAVERIEILTGSASAIYGADALGGAVNLILRGDYTGAGANIRFGTSGEGDATERNASLTFGGKRESFSGMLVLDYFDRDPLRGTDRNLTQTRDFTRFGGADARSALAYPANVYSLDFDANFNPNPLPGLNSPFAGVPAGTDGTGLTPADFVETDGVLNLFDSAPFTTLLAEANRKSVFATGRYDVSSAVSLFGEALYTHREQIVQFEPDGLLLGQFGLFTVPADNPFNPFGVPVGVDYRFVELGPRANDSTTDFSRVLVGAEGGLFERFDWQVYLLADRDKSEIFNRNFANAFLHAAAQEALNATDPAVALNVFSTTGNNNPATLAAIRDAGQTTDALSTRAHMGEAILRGSLVDLPAGPLSAVFGVNVRREKVDFLAPGVLDLRDTRDSKAAFAEVSVPLVGAAQRVPAVHSLDLSAAVRYDDYDQIGSSTNPQFGLTWRPISSMLLRATYGEAFKAPTAFDLFLPRFSVPSSALDPSRGNMPSEFIETLGGNPALAPETGQSIAAGLVWEPSFAPGLQASLNGFRLEQEDFITTLGVDLILANEELFPGRVVRAPADPTDPPGFAGELISVDTSGINFGRITVKGADLQLQYAFLATAYGRFVSTLAGTYIDEFKILVTPGTAPINQVSHANTSGYPVRFKGSAGLSWSREGWSAAITARYLSSYTDYDGVSELPSQTWLDAQLGYRFGEHAAVTLLEGLETAVGVINLTDNQGDFSNNFAGYDSQQSDIRGRFYYLSLKMRF